MRRKLLVRSIISIIIWILLDTVSSSLLSDGLKRNYGLQQHSEIFAVGHSHLMMALDRKKIEQELGVKMSKYAREGMNMNERLLMTKQFMFSPYSDSIKWVIVGVDIYSFQGKGLSENSHLQFYPFYDDETISKYLKSLCSPSDYYQHKLVKLSRYSEDLINSSVRGWMNDDSNRKTNHFDTTASELSLKKWMRSIGFNEELKNSLDSIICTVNIPGVKTILLNTPTLSVINRYQPERYDSIISYYHRLEKKYDNVYFLDLNPIYQDSVSLFSDPVHMNVEGRKKVTDAVIKFINNLNEPKAE